MQQSGLALAPEPEQRDYDDPEYWEYVVAEFTCGFCSELALTLHDRFGWPLMAEIAGDGGLYHAWVLNPDGRAVDINGVHADGFARTWPDWKTTIRAMSREGLAAFGLNPEGLAWAVEILAARPAVIATPFDFASSKYAGSWAWHEAQATSADAA